MSKLHNQICHGFQSRYKIRTHLTLLFSFRPKFSSHRAQWDLIAFRKEVVVASSSDIAKLSNDFAEGVYLVGTGCGLFRQFWKWRSLPSNLVFHRFTQKTSSLALFPVAIRKESTKSKVPSDLRTYPNKFHRSSLFCFQFRAHQI